VGMKLRLNIMREKGVVGWSASNSRNNHRQVSFAMSSIVCGGRSRFDTTGSP
jgi:hypothetical protein